MSTSLLYHGFGIRGYRYVKTEYIEGKVIFHVEQPRERLCCAACTSRKVVLRGHSDRLFRHVPTGGKQVWIQFSVPRVGCLDCGCVRRVKVAFADPRRRYTRGFARYVLRLSDQARGRALGGQLGHGQGNPKDASAATLCPASACALVEAGHRRDRDSQRAHLHDRGAGPGERRGGLRGRRQRDGFPAAVLEACELPAPASRPWRSTCPRRTSRRSKHICQTPISSSIASTS